MTVQANACTAQQAACVAAEQRRLEAIEKLTEAERKDRRRHLCGARRKLHYEFGIPKSSLELAAEVTHEQRVWVRFYRRGHWETRSERAYEFKVDGLTFRVTQHERTESDGFGVSYVKVNGEQVYDYVVRVFLPDLDRRWRGLRKPGASWYRLSHQAHLGELLLKRGLCA